MRDFQNWDADKKMRFQRRIERQSRTGSIWTGFFLLLIGVAALVKATVTDFPDWIFSWEMFLIVLGLFVGIRHGFKGGTWFILIIIGSIFLVNEINPDLGFRRYLWPTMMIALGIFFILRPRRHRWEDGEKKSTLQGDIPIDGATYSNEEFVDSTSIFGGAKKNIISKNFKGGDLVNIFGGTELDLTQADFTGTAVIELTTVFGGTKLIVPSNWSIKSDAVIIFGGIEDKRKMQTITENPDKTLLLRGTVIFGGIDIKSF
ncbi:MAG: LiaF domain-containing protein [Bacteroidota bacterium]